MKKTLIAAIAALAAVPALAGAAPIEAQVQRVQYVPNTYTCVAQSSHAYGYSTNYTLASARTNALYQCALRTPTYDNCVVTRCQYNP